MVSARSGRSRGSGGKPNYKDVGDEGSSSSGEESDEEFEVAASPPKASQSKQRKKASPNKAPSPSSPAEADGSQHGNSSDSDEEEELRPRTGKRVKKTNPKLQKKGSKTAAAKGTKAPKRPPVPLFHEEQMTDADGLKDVIRNKPNSMAMAVERWWKHFVHPVTAVSAVHEIVQLIVEVSGHKDRAQRLPPSLFAEDDDVDIDSEITDLCQDCAESGVLEKHVHIGTKTGAGKQLRTNLEDFFLKFALLAPRTELVDLQHKLVSTWISALSNCSLQEIRNVATLAGMQILVGLCTVASTVGTEIANKSRLKQAQSSSNKTNKDKEARLGEELEDLINAKKMLTEEISALFASVFVHRHTDTSSEIRARCVTCLGGAIQAYGEQMMENHYLKYISWALNDKSKEVRSAALDELLEIYSAEDEGWARKLEQLTGRFKARFMDMRNDSEKDVAVKGIKLCKMLFINGEMEPEDEGWTDIYESLICEEDEVRAAAAGFVEEFYIKKQLEELYDTACKDSNDSINHKEFIMKGMVELIHRVVEDADMQDLVPIIRSFATIEDWGMQDWSLMCNLLLQEDEDEALDGEQKETLLRILTASLACCLDPDDKPKRNQKYKDTKAKATAAIVSFLPDMLTAMGTEVPKLTLLMGLVTQMDLAAITNSHKKDMDKIVAEVCDAVVKGQDASLLAAAAAALEELSAGEYPLKRMVEPAIVMLIEKLFLKLEEAKNSYLKTGKLTLTQTLWIQRLSIVNGCVDICSPEAQPQAWEAALDMLNHTAENSAQRLPNDGACLLSNFCVQSVCWRVQEALDAPVSGSTKVGELDRAVRSREEILVPLQKICNDGGQPWAVRLQAMVGACDLMQLFGVSLKDALVGEGAEEEEVLMGDVIATRSMCACEELLHDLSVMPKLPKPETWKGTTLLNKDGFREDDQDKWNLGKTTAFSNLKPLLYCLDDNGESPATPSLMASVVLQGKYNPQIHRDVTEFFRNALAKTVRVQTETLRWLQAHQMSFIRTSDAVAQYPKLDVEPMSLSIIQSINSLKDRDGTLYGDYLTNAVAWVLEDLRNVDFLSAVTVLIPRISDDTARELIGTLDEHVDAHESDMEERHAERIASFRRRLQDTLEADAASESSLGSAVKRKGKVKERIDFGHADDSDAQRSTGMRTPVKAQRSKPSKARASAARKRRVVDSDEEDEEGFVSANPRPGPKARKPAAREAADHSDSEESITY